MLQHNPAVAMDTAHINLISSLVQAQKPQRILEIGLGSGSSLQAIRGALEWNQQPYSYTLVDNWFDWSGRRPAEVAAFCGPTVTIIDSAEGDFVRQCTEQYDFIVSDGDHDRAEQWSDRVYCDLLAPGGTLIYHDIDTVTGSYPNLLQILEQCRRNGWTHQLFNQSSRPDERCHRGLLVIFKDNK